MFIKKNRSLFCELYETNCAQNAGRF